VEAADNRVVSCKKLYEFGRLVYIPLYRCYPIVLGYLVRMTDDCCHLVSAVGQLGKNQGSRVPACANECDLHD
jgi:hypothetical protein